jgi:hypothetical protein
MAEKKYKLYFRLNDGTEQSVEFAVPEGEPGYTPVKGVDYFDGADGYTPVKGTDYYTDADKAEMVSAVLAALPNAEGVGF